MDELDNLLEEQELLFRIIEANEERTNPIFKISDEEMAPFKDRLAEVNQMIDDTPND